MAEKELHRAQNNLYANPNDACLATVEKNKALDLQAAKANYASYMQQRAKIY